MKDDIKQKRYKYEAINLQRKTVRGIFLAESEDDLRIKLAAQQLYLTSFKIDKDKSPNAFLSVSGKVKMDEITTFCRQFATMISVGIPVAEVIANLREQKFNDFFKKILSQMHEDVMSGQSLSLAMSRHKKVFPAFMLSMIGVGEASGKMDEVMESLADYYENDTKLKKKTKSALMYPMVLIIMAIGIVALMMIFVIPTFRKALDQMDVEMPALTQAIMSMSEFFIANWMIMALAIVLIVVVLKLIGRTRNGRYFFDMLGMKTPYIKTMKTNVITSRFARSFALLVASGLDMVDAMETIARILGNKYVEKKFRRAIEDVRTGMGITMALEQSGIFPPMLIQMLSVGEKTGSVDGVLKDSYAFFDDAVDRSINGLLAVVQPLILCFIGGAVGVLFIAIYSPMLAVMKQLGS